MKSVLYKRAKRKVRKKKIFYFHFAIFLILSTFLFCINLLTTPLDLWFQFPVLSWSVLLSIHFLIAIGIPFFSIDDNWESREISKELKKMGARPLPSPKTSLFPVDEELELKDFKHLREEWKDQDFV